MGMCIASHLIAKLLQQCTYHLTACASLMQAATSEVGSILQQQWAGSSRYATGEAQDTPSSGTWIRLRHSHIESCCRA